MFSDSPPSLAWSLFDRRQWTKYKDQHKDDISLGLSDVIAYALERRLGGLCNTSLINRDPNFNPKEEGSLIADGSLPRFIQKVGRQSQ